MVKKQDPLWSKLFEEIALQKWGGADNIHKGRLKQANDFHAAICEDAQAVLKRPPVVSDLDQDFAELMVKRWLRTFTTVRAREISSRLDRLKWLAEMLSQRFNRPAIDWDAVPTSRRDARAQLTAAAVQVPEVSPDDLPAGLDPKIVSTSLDTVLAQYVRERLLGKSKDTTRLMQVAVRKFEGWLCRPAILSDLTRDRVLSWIEYLLDRGDLARASIRTLQERLLALWRFACQKHWLIELPQMQMIDVPERTPDAWKPNELVALMDAAKGMPGNMKGTMELVPWSLYWSTLIYFLFDTGERIGGVTQVHHDDVVGEWVTVRAEYRKGKKRDKRFKLRKCTIDGIAELRRLTNGKRVKRVFEFPYSSTYLWNKFNKVLEAAGLPTDRRSKYHKMRRTAASEFEAAGGNATKLLDHNSRATTMKYLDPDVTKETQLVDIVAGIGEEPKPNQESQILAKLREVLSQR